MEVVSQPHPHSYLIQALQTFYREEAGMEPRRIRVNLDHDTVIVLLEQALSPAEKQLAQTKEGVELLKTYEERLQEVVRPRLQLLIEAAIKRRIVTAYVHTDVLAGTIIGVFVLAEEPAQGDT